MAQTATITTPGVTTTFTPPTVTSTTETAAQRLDREHMDLERMDRERMNAPAGSGGMTSRSADTPLDNTARRDAAGNLTARADRN